MNANGKVTTGQDRASNLRLRSFVRAHGVECDVGQHRVVLAGFLDFQNFAPLISAALGANVMRQLALVTVRTFGETARRQKVVRAALGGAGL